MYDGNTWRGFAVRRTSYLYSFISRSPVLWNVHVSVTYPVETTRRMKGPHIVFYTFKLPHIPASKPVSRRCSPRDLSEWFIFRAELSAKHTRRSLRHRRPAHSVHNSLVRGVVLTSGSYGDGEAHFGPFVPGLSDGAYLGGTRRRSGQRSACGRDEIGTD